MNDKQKKVITWIKSGMDYTEGINLLIEITHEQYYASFFTGRRKTHAEKLAYLLLKSALLADIRNWKNFITNVQNNAEILIPVLPKISRSLPPKPPDRQISAAAPVSQSPLSKNNQILVPVFTEAEILEEVKPLAQYPAIIRRIIHQYAALFQERSRLHTTMVEMPDSNALTVCAKRAEIFNVIKSISERLEKLFKAKEDYDKKGIIPSESAIFPPEEDKGEPVPDLLTLDEASLKHLKKNLQSGNSKDQIILDFQRKKAEGFKNPMPDGPKRKKLEMRIAERNKKIEEIDWMLLRPSEENVAKK